MHIHRVVHRDLKVINASILEYAGYNTGVCRLQYLSMQASILEYAG